MSFEEKRQEIEDPQVEAALRHFRESIHGWSDGQFSKARTVTPARRRSGWRLWSKSLQAPVLGWGLAAILTVSAITIPTEIHHQRQLAAEQQARLDAAKAQSQPTVQPVVEAATTTMSDEELLSHVDSDIAQAAPDAMEPLARLMNESATSK